MPTVKCKCCKEEFYARQADLNRGRGKFCSKSCKAKKQEQRTGQYKAFINRRNDQGDRYEYDPSDDEYWNNKDY